MKTTLTEELAALVETRILNRDASGMVIKRLSQEDIYKVYCWWEHHRFGAKGARFMIETATFSAYLDEINSIGGPFGPYSSTQSTMSLIGIGMMAGALIQQGNNEDFDQEASPSKMMQTLQMVDVGSPEDPFPAATDNETALSCTLQLIRLQPRFSLISEAIDCLSELAYSKSRKPNESLHITRRCPFIPFLMGTAAMGINFDEAWDELVEEI